MNYEIVDIAIDIMKIHLRPYISAILGSKIITDIMPMKKYRAKEPNRDFG